MNINDTLNERAETHGDFTVGATTFNTIMREINKSTTLDSVQYYAATMMAAKLVRIIHGNANEIDHWRDIVGYATLGGRLALADEQEIAQPVEPYIAIKTGGTV
ncbi:hypothetical protein HPC38_02520 [Pasteurellaceae bacterium HPA106]|uniref:DUF6378 domain-containing protein n=1 Tax=Spirabiliibacterium pneumoniae TaxID=221400 RepID=UPI001AACC394|nr:DUF6378 domain-containing protein [Spirabiliibacterium pneumoniae]MBE2895754.1 hypothetical protein [Spirabiliibacterium pneumoniae]